MGKVQAHLSEYVGRYVVLASIVLVPLAGIVGDLAAQVGPDTKIGHALLSVASAIGTAAAIVVWLRNRGIFESAPILAQTTAQTAAAAAGTAAAVAASTGTQGLPVAGSLVDPEVDAVQAHELPSDDVEFGAPPPPAPDETNTPVQPSQAGLIAPEGGDPAQGGDPDAPTDLPPRVG